MDEDVLAELKRVSFPISTAFLEAQPRTLQKWQEKVLASHVAEFDSPQQPPPQQVSQLPPQHHPYPPHAMHMVQPPYAAHNPYSAVSVPVQPSVKAEPLDGRYMLAPGMSYTLPPLPGPTLTNGRQLPPPIPHPGGQTGVLSFARPSGPGQTAVASPRPFSSQPATSQPTTQQPAQQQRIPQVDGPSESSGEEDTPSPSPSHGQAFAPRPSHPSLPQPLSNPAPTLQRDDSEAINSDLDDSDTEGEEDAEEGTVGETDIVFCTYDKVCPLIIGNELYPCLMDRQRWLGSKINGNVF